MTVRESKKVRISLEDKILSNDEDDNLFPNLDSIILDENQLNIKDGFCCVLVVEDDKYVAKDYGYALSGYGFSVSYAFDADQAVKIIYLYGACFDFIVLDIRMDHGRYLTSFETAFGTRTGSILSKEMQDYSPCSKKIALTNSNDEFDEAWFESNQNYYFCNKKVFTPVIFSKYLHIMRVEEDSTSCMDAILESVDNWKYQLANLIKQSSNLTIQFIEEQVMGDKYEAFQVGAQGKRAHAHDMVFNQILEGGLGNLDLKALAGQLSQLREAMAISAEKQQDYIEIGNVASAELELSNGNIASALVFLRKTGKWTLEIAEKIGVGIAVAAIRSAIGL